ncbi:MAG: inositol monophosphatase [Chloroflexota bacterium]|nr:inositol monophosphatase [Chloroflexota bacterium]
MLEHARSAAKGVGSKSTPTDPVSDADRAADTLLTARLRAAFPDDGIVSEESERVTGSSGRTWYVDPLDGTVNYLYRIPHWSVSVACADAAGGLAGVVYDPLRDELFSAARGSGAYLGERRLTTSEVGDPGLALVATGFSYAAAERAAQAGVLARVAGQVRDVRRAGSAALDLAWVAAGRLDAYFEVSRSAWDSAAGELLVREAGGAVTWTEHTEIVASGRPLHAPLVALLRASHEDHG